MSIFDWLTVTNTVLDIMFIGSLAIVGVAAWRKTRSIIKASQRLRSPASHDLDATIQDILRKR